MKADVSSRGPATVELRMAPRAENLSLARLALAGVGPVAGASDGEVADLKLAVTEACTNAILHAYADGEGNGGQLVVRYRVGPGRSRSRWRTTVSDSIPTTPGRANRTPAAKGWA